jgi:hypothetical protein
LRALRGATPERGTGGRMERVKRHCRIGRSEGCHGTRGSTLTSWRRGRIRGGATGADLTGRPCRVPKTERAEDAGGTAHSGEWGVGSGSLWLAHSKASKPDSCVAITCREGLFRESWAPLGVLTRKRHDASASIATLRRRIGGEFDPGSGSTLAACLMHASRARAPSGVLRGGRVRNTWATCPGVGDSRGKPRVIPHTFGSRAEI